MVMLATYRAIKILIKKDFYCGDRCPSLAVVDTAKRGDKIETKPSRIKILLGFFDVNKQQCLSYFFLKGVVEIGRSPSSSCHQARSAFVSVVLGAGHPGLRFARYFVGPYTSFLFS